MQRAKPREQVIPILHASDAMGSSHWWEKLGFAIDFVHQFEPGLPLFVGLTRGPLTVFLSEHSGDARPHGLIYLRLENMREIAAAFGAYVEENDWGPDCQLTDPDGNRIRIGLPDSE